MTVKQFIQYFETQLLLHGVVLSDEQKRFILMEAAKYERVVDPVKVVDIFIKAMKIEDKKERERMIKRLPILIKLEK